jgi:hypothetical protein
MPFYGSYIVNELEYKKKINQLRILLGSGGLYDLSSGDGNSMNEEVRSHDLDNYDQT